MSTDDEWSYVSVRALSHSDCVLWDSFLEADSLVISQEERESRQKQTEAERVDCESTDKLGAQ